MFEEITEAKEREGIRGFMARHFGAVTDADVARDEARSVAALFSVLSFLTAVVGGILVGPGAVVIAAVFAVLALLLRFTLSRTAAVILLVLTGLNALASFPQLLPFAWFLFAVRATQLTFGYQRLLRAAANPSLPPVAFQPPIVSARGIVSTEAPSEPPPVAGV